jgi:hypothetical protein
VIRRIVAVLLLAVVCAHPAAAGPCEVLADAIRSSFEADADLDRVYAHLSDGPAWRGTDAAIAPTRSGRARRATIAQRRYLAEFAAPETEEGFAPATTRLIVLRDTQAPGRTICRVRLVGENAGRAEDMRPADAASESARRMPMAVLEPLLPALARARIAAPSFDPAELLGAGAESTGDGGVVFMAGGARFQISLARVPDTDGEVFGTLARLVPELGNRERPLGTFRLVVTTRLADIRIE